MRKQLWWLLAPTLAFSACKTDPLCQSNPKALSASTLERESLEPLDLLWDDAADRPKLIHGVFVVEASSIEDAAQRFLAEHADFFHLSKDHADLVLSATRHGKIGTYLRYQGVSGALPVFLSEVIVHVRQREDGAFEVRDVNLAQRELTAPFGATGEELEASKVIALALQYSSLTQDSPRRAPPEVLLGIYAEGPEPTLAYRVRVSSSAPLASWEYYLDAYTGKIIAARDRLMSANGSAKVFDANPIASTGNINLTDNNNADSTTLTNARFTVTLPRLDGSGFLRGTFVDAKSVSVARAQNAQLSFQFTRSQSGFEEAMAYFHIDRVQGRIQSELGFNDVNNRRQEVFTDAIADANAFYDPGDLSINMGTGGVDTGEDADVFVHEYGHSTQDDQVPNFGSGGDEGAMGEGFGDYLATSMLDTLTTRDGHTQQIIPECLGEWFATAFGGGCLRRVDGTKHFPEAADGEVHDDGEMWASPLFSARERLGADVMDTIVLESHFLLSATDTFFVASQALLNADQNVFAGQHKSILAQELIEQGVSRSITAPANLPDVLQSVNTSVDNARQNNLYVNGLDDTKTVTQAGAAGLRLHFAQIDTELDPSCLAGACDNIYLYDSQGRLFQILNGSSTNTTSVIIPGSSVAVRLVSDSSVQRFGYHIDRVEVMGVAQGASCGDGQINAGEQCDGNNLNGQSCAAQGFDSGTLSCNANCTLNTAQCQGGAGPVCGNGVQEGNEECDGADLGGQDCSTLSLENGSLKCSAACTLDASLCLLPQCN